MKKKSNLLFKFSHCFICFCIFLTPILGQYYGGSNDDTFGALQQTSDGGYIIGGISNSPISDNKTENSQGGFDFWVLKLNANNSIQWQNTIGGSDAESLRAIKQTTDGGYILGGNSVSPISGDKTESNLGGQDIWVVKLSSTGGIQWQNTIGGNSNDYGVTIQQTTDGGYFIGGYSNSNISGDKTEPSQGGYDFWLIKLDTLGNIQWQNTIGGNGSDVLYNAVQTHDGGYVLSGLSLSSVSGDKTTSTSNWLLKLDSVGNILWQNDDTYSGGASVQQTTDGGFISIRGNYIVKLDSLSDLEWENIYDTSCYYCHLYSIKQTSNGGFIALGETEGVTGYQVYSFVRFDGLGNIKAQWTKAYSRDDLGYGSIQQTADGGYIFGYSDHCYSNNDGDGYYCYEDYHLIKFSSECYQATTFAYTLPCVNLNNGAVRVNLPTTSGHSFLWNTGATTRKLSNVPSGAYTVTITNTSSGCTWSKTANLRQGFSYYSLDVPVFL